MKIYYERYIICEKCRDSQRQTAQQLPLDKIGKSLTGMFIREFLEAHIDCGGKFFFSKWQVGKFNFNNNYFKK